MNERSQTTEFTKRLNPQTYEVIKHSDRFTGGVFDLSVTGLDVTCWLEMKYKRPSESWKAVVKADQITRGIRLYPRSGGRAWFVCYVEDPKRVRTTQIYKPAAMRVVREGGSPAVISWVLPAELGMIDLFSLFPAADVLMMEGWNYDFPCALIKNAGLRASSCVKVLPVPNF